MLKNKLLVLDKVKRLCRKSSPELAEEGAIAVGQYLQGAWVPEEENFDTLKSKAVW